MVTETLLAQIETIVAAHDFGKPSAAKRGRRQDMWPYVPVIDYGEQTIGVHRTKTEQIRGKAFNARQNAVDYAAAVIEARRRSLRDNLLNPRYRALRKQHGLPAELTQ